MSTQRTYKSSRTRLKELGKSSDIITNNSSLMLDAVETLLPTPNSGGLVISSEGDEKMDDFHPQGSDILNDSTTLNASQLFDFDYEPNIILQQRYKEYISKHGILEFLNVFLPPEVSKRELGYLILDLGYPKTCLINYHQMSPKEVATQLVQLVSESHNGSNFGLQTNPDLRFMDPRIPNGDSTNLKVHPRVISAKPTQNSTKYTIPDFLKDLHLSKRILLITGAGILTSLGIPDFRSFKGLYSQLSHLNLKDPQQGFDIEAFKRDPGIFFSIAHLILPPDGKYTIMHSFIKLLQDKGKLLRNYTQNIDNLEKKVGILEESVIQCHGSFGSATCLTCHSRFAGHKIFNHIRHKQVPRCLQCYSIVNLNEDLPIDYGVIKPDITFFGEDLPKRYHQLIGKDTIDCDLVIVVGTSLKVEPVAGIINKVSSSVPKVLLNKDDIPDRGFDLRLLGYCDDVVTYLASQLGPEWDIPHKAFNNQSQWKIDEENVDLGIYSVSST